MSCPNYYFKSLNCFSHNPTFTHLLCDYTSFTLCYFTIYVYEPLPGIYICIYVWILSSFFEYLKFSGFTTKRCFKNLIYSIFTAVICVHWLEYLWSFLRNRLKLLEKKLYIFLVILFPLSNSCLIFFSIELLNFYSQFWNEKLHQCFLIFQERTEKIKQILENQVAYVQNVIKPQILSQFIAEHVCIKIECFDSLFSMWLKPIVLSYIEKKVVWTAKINGSLSVIYNCKGYQFQFQLLHVLYLQELCNGN
jgi:hypothetical protein